MQVQAEVGSPDLWPLPPRSARESEDEEEEEERPQSASRGCTLQYQHATLQVFTQFHTTSSEGTDQVVTMLGPDWLVEVTDLVSDFMRVGDPRVARMVDSSTLAGLEPGTTPFKVGMGQGVCHDTDIPKTGLLGPQPQGATSDGPQDTLACPPALLLEIPSSKVKVNFTLVKVLSPRLINLAWLSVVPE